MTDEQIKRLRELAEGMSAIPALLDEDEIERLREIEAAAQKYPEVMRSMVVRVDDGILLRITFRGDREAAEISLKAALEGK